MLIVGKQPRPPRREQGQSLAEYGLVLALIAVVCVGALGTLGGQISASLGTLAGNIGAAMGGGSGGNNW
jgi:pilus assembly protein Flp/PilA